MPSTNLEKIYTSPYRSFNFQQLFFYDIFLRNAYFTSILFRKGKSRRKCVADIGRQSIRQSTDFFTDFLA